MTTLEVRGSQPKQHVAMRLQEKRDKLAQTQSVYRYPYLLAAKARKMLRSLVPRLAKDAVYYRTALEDLRFNIGIQRGLAYKNDATASRYPRLRRNLEKWGVARSVLDELRRTTA